MRNVDPTAAKFKSEETPAPDEARGPLPPLEIRADDPTATARQLTGLIAKRADFLFNGHGIVQIIVESDGMPQAVEVSSEAVRVLGHKISQPFRRGPKGPKPAAIKADIASIYLNGLRGEWRLKHFQGITTSPILANNGDIRIADGFDMATGLWCHNIPELNLPPRPTKQDAETSLKRLRHFFRTFPFADSIRTIETGEDGLQLDIVNPDKNPGLDESAFLVALVTAVCRPSLPLAPGLLIRASKFSGAGTGKGLCVRAACIIGSGATPAAFTSGHDETEFDKRLTSALVQGRPSIFLDNFNAKQISSDILASALTENPCQVRLFGKTEMVPLHVKTFIGITGNAVEIAEDTCRRFLAVEFDAHCEHPERRKFPDGFLDSVFESRGQLLSDILTIWRWGRQQRLPPGEAFGSYEIWAKWCRDPILALGGRDPADRVAELKAADPERRALIEIFDAWWVQHQNDLVKAVDIDDGVVGLIDPKARSSDGKISRQKMARWLDHHKGVRLGGYHLEQIKDKARTRATAYYKLHFIEKKEKT